MQIMKAIKILVITFIGLFFVALFFGSCTKYDNPTPEFDEYVQKNDTSIKKKVLFINVEGAVGLEMEKIMPVNIKKMLEHSKYSFSGLSEVNSGDATTWASLMTGVSQNKHKIENESFIRNTTLDNTQLQIPFFPTVFFKLNELRPDLKTVTVTSWEPLSRLLLVDANKRINVTSDAQAKDSIIKQLVTTDPSLALVSFRSVLQAGITNGFSTQNPAYVTAVNTVDDYIGQIVASLKERKNYAREDWLVIVTSNHGGIDTTYGGSSDPERNIFSIFYHPKYQPAELKGKTLFSARFGPSIKAAAPDPTGIYNISDRSLTVEFQMRINPNASGTYSFGNWNKVLGKSNWGIYRQNNNMKIYMTGGGATIEQGLGNVSFADGLWHSMTVVMNTDTNAKTRTVRMYYDGALLLKDVVVPGFVGPINDFQPFDIGGSAVDFNVAEVRVWNKVLSDFQIAENACLTEITPTHRDYNSLIGYWPGKELATVGATTVLKNAVTGMPNMIFNSTTPPFSISTYSLPCDLGATSVKIENHSVVPQIYYWLGIPIDTSWGLDSKTFLSRFELELE